MKDCGGLQIPLDTQCIMILKMENGGILFSFFATSSNRRSTFFTIIGKQSSQHHKYY